jgi:hypothetical protein
VKVRYWARKQLAVPQPFGGAAVDGGKRQQQQSQNQQQQQQASLSQDRKKRSLTRSRGDSDSDCDDERAAKLDPGDEEREPQWRHGCTCCD